MNFKLLCKTVLIIAVLALLVMMGMHNRNTPSGPAADPAQEVRAAGLLYVFWVLRRRFRRGRPDDGRREKGASKPAKEK